MTPYEMMLSESQERMLMVLKPGREAEAEAIFHKWELDFAVIGEVTDTGHMVLELQRRGRLRHPARPAGRRGAALRPPVRQPDDYKAWAGVKPLGDVPESTDIGADLLKLMASPDLASRRWIWEQYDSQVGADTRPAPGRRRRGRARPRHRRRRWRSPPTARRAIATPTPYEGGKQAVAETYRNLCAVGATPLAITNCLNFGNPQRPEIMGQIVGCARRHGRSLPRARLSRS